MSSDNEKNFGFIIAQIETNHIIWYKRIKLRTGK
jgi:hypothetical protein